LFDSAEPLEFGAADYPLLELADSRTPDIAPPFLAISEGNARCEASPRCEPKPVRFFGSQGSIDGFGLRGVKHTDSFEGKKAGTLLDSRTAGIAPPIFGDFRGESAF
jgi:hypothetical protein